jgi:hypothetical protein
MAVVAPSLRIDDVAAEPDESAVLPVQVEVDLLLFRDGESFLDAGLVLGRVLVAIVVGCRAASTDGQPRAMTSDATPAPINTWGLMATSIECRGASLRHNITNP